MDVYIRYFTDSRKILVEGELLYDFTRVKPPKSKHTFAKTTHPITDKNILEDIYEVLSSKPKCEDDSENESKTFRLNSS